MNTLARRIGELLAGEREEVADLAHRLRTPATALRLNVDSLSDSDERARLEANVDALARAVDEVIRTARRPVTESAGHATDLARVAAERVAFWSALADDTGRLVETSLPGVAVLVRASSDDAVAALDALLENVFAHTPDEAALRVAVRPLADGGGSLVVEDAGPGLPGGLVAQRGVSGRMGSTGLGLDIARRTAEAAGGSMVLGVSSLGGARVELTFGPPA
jgi:signal transduction histidine kinase